MEGQRLVAWNLRALRVERRLSQEQLAIDAGLDVSYVGRLERATENPTIAVLDRLSTALGVHVSRLLAEPPKGETQPRPLRAGRKSIR